MYKTKTSYSIEENVYKKIDILTNSSKEIIGTSTNLISQLSTLFESIEDDITTGILSDAGKINDFISLISSFTKNELQEIKLKSKIIIEKAEKRKLKIIKLKEENKKLEEKLKEAEIEKQQLILNIDSISSQLSDLYMENQTRERNLTYEKMNKKKEKIIKEKYIKEINNMQKDIDILKEKNKTFENNATKFRRKSLILEEKNKKLNDELGAQTVQFLKKMKEQNELRNTINSLRLQNDNLSKKVKNSISQVEKWQIKYKDLEEKIEKGNNVKKNLENNFIRIDNNNNNNRKSGKKVIQLREKQKLDSDSENDLRYKTFSNLNDLLAEESDISIKKDSSNKKNEIVYNKKKKKGNFRRYSFDLDYIFEINLNTYENFFC
jgi:hypothetical protein